MNKSSPSDDHDDAHQRPAFEPDGPPTAGGDGAAAPDEAMLAALLEDVRVAEARTAQAVVRAGALAGSGVAERVEGQPLELLLGTACKLTGSDRKTLISAGETLAGMPVLRGLFVTGQVSWGQIRMIVGETKRLSRAERHTVDQRIAATAAERAGLAGFDPEELVWAAQRAVDELRDVAELHRDERDAIATSYLGVQSDLFGGIKAFGHWPDPAEAAVIVGALDAAAGPPRPAPAASHPSDGGDGGEDDACATARQGGWTPTARGRQYAKAMVAMSAAILGGDPTGNAVADDDGAVAGDGAAMAGDGAAMAGGDGDAGLSRLLGRRRAKPSLTVRVNLADVTVSAAGTIDLAVRGPLPRLSAAVVEALADDCELRVAVFDGARPLATSARRTAPSIPAKTALAVQLRDQGCRWPGCAAPIAHTDIHHLTHRVHGGDHDPDNLVCLCRRDHVLAHQQGWTLTLTAATGELSGHRRGKPRWRTLPHATTLTATPPDQADDPADPRGTDPPGDPCDPPGDPPGDPPEPPEDPAVDAHGQPMPF